MTCTLKYTIVYKRLRESHILALCPLLSSLRVEKERNATAQELEESQMALQQDQVEKAGLEKNGKMVGHQISDMKGRLDEIQRALHEADGTKRWVGRNTVLSVTVTQ